MANFQRSRSKVWWGDSPPNIGSPVAQASNQQDVHRTPRNDDWEPQLPHWVGPELALDTSSSPELPLQWMHRRSSPSSHKSQDSGFSDSDSSPPNSHHENVDRDKPRDNSNKDVNDSNAIKESPYCNTPRTYSSRHNSKLIETPKDLEHYIETDCNKENKATKKNHKEMGIEIPDAANISKDTSEVNINTNPGPSDKCNTNKSFTESQKNADNDEDKRMPDNSVKDMRGDNLELIRMSDNNQVAVNNQPRIRSPVSNVYQAETFAGFKKIHLELDERTQIHGKICTEKYFFQRTRLHKSLNLDSRKEIDQTLSSDTEKRSLDYIQAYQNQDQEEVFEVIRPIAEDEQLRTRFTPKHLTDTLHLKTNKKFIQRKTRSKLKSNILNLFPSKNNIKCSDELAGGTCENGRVPTLGLPRSQDSNDWVVVGYPSNEKLIENYEERLVCDKRPKEKRKIDKTTSPSSKCSPLRKITPPPQFQDMNDLQASLPVIENRRPAFDRSMSAPMEIDGGDYKMDNRPSPDISTQDNIGSMDRINSFNLQIDMTNASTPMIAVSKERNMRSPVGIGNKLKPVNLLKDFEKSAENDKKTNEYADKQKVHRALQKVRAKQPECVQLWLGEMVGMYEPECMSTLQSKAISADMKALVSASSATITGNIRKVQTHGQIVIHQFYEVMRDIELCGHCISESSDGITSLLCNISEFVLTHSITLNTRPPGETPERWNKITHTLNANAQKIIDLCDDVKLELNESNPEKNILVKNIEDLLDIFIETAKAVLIQQMKTLVSIIEEPPSDIVIKSTLTSISHLGVSLTPDSENGLSETCLEKLKEITELPFVECGVPRALLTAIIESMKSSIKALALRALTTICVTSEAVKQFEEGGGIEIISDILGVESNPEPQMREAVTVLTQVTAPWLKGRYDIKQLDTYLDSIIKNLSAIMSRTQCCQLLLLCTACLVNLLRVLLHLESPAYGNTSYAYKNDIIQTILKHGTVEKLLEAVKNRGPHVSVFLQEQTAHLLCILSEVDACTDHLASIPSVAVALVCFLQPIRGTPNKPNEMQAEFRLVNKSTEALSRLCNMKEVSNQIVMLGGVQRIVKLIKSQQKLQNKKSSDQILINCLRTLRIIHSYNPAVMADSISENDMKTMLEASLMESLIFYSSKQESYV